MVALLGVVDIDGPNLDVDFDADADLGGGAEGISGVFGFLVKLVNAQDVPITFVLSLLAVFMWLFSIIGNASLNPNHKELTALLLLFPNFILSTVFVKLVTHPLRPLMRSIKNDQEHQEPLVGQSGVVKSRVLDSNFGQVEVPRDKGAPALINAILPEEAESLVRGDQVLVIDHLKERDRFLVKALDADQTLL